MQAPRRILRSSTTPWYGSVTIPSMCSVDTRHLRNLLRHGLNLLQNHSETLRPLSSLPTVLATLRIPSRTSEEKWSQYLTCR